MRLQPDQLPQLLPRGSDRQPGTNDGRFLFALHYPTEGLTRQAGSGTTISKLMKTGAFLAGRAEGLPELQGHADDR